MKRTVFALSMIALLVTGLVTLGFAQGLGRGSRGPGGPGIWAGIGFGGGPVAGAPLERMAKALELTDEQQEKLKSLHDAAREEMTPLRNQAELLSVELRQLWRADELDSESILAKSKELATVRAKLAEIGTRLHLEVAQVLTPEQRAKMAQAKHLRRGWRGDQGVQAPERRRGGNPPRFRRGQDGPGPRADSPRGFRGPGPRW